MNEFVFNNPEKEKQGETGIKAVSKSSKMKKFFRNQIVMRGTHTQACLGHVDEVLIRTHKGRV